MLHRRLEQAKLFMSGSRGVDASRATKREGVELVGEAQAFGFEGGDDGHEDRIALGAHGSCGGLRPTGIDSISRSKTEGGFKSEVQRAHDMSLPLSKRPREGF